MRWPRAHRAAGVAVLALALTAAGPALSTAQARSAPHPAPTAAHHARPAISSGDLADTSATQQRWLSVPKSRIVLNPYDFGSTGTEADQNSRPDLPLSAGYYADDKALTADGLLHTYRAASAAPPTGATTASYTADFSSLGGADPAWTAKDVKATAGSDGSADLTVDSGAGWGNIAQSVTVPDVSATPDLTVTVPRTTGTWALKINTGGADDAYTLQQDTAETGTFTYDLRAVTGWSGRQTFTLKLYAVGAGAGTSFSALSVRSQAPFPDSGQSTAFADDFADASGWSTAAHSGNGATLTSDGSYGTVTAGSTSGFGAVEHAVTADLSATPVLSVRVAATTAKWALKINTGGASDAFTVQADTTRTGTFSYDLASLTGWSGTHTFTLKLFQVGAKGSSTSFDRLSLHSGSPWLQAASSYTTTWTPQALDYGASYAGSGKLSGADLFHGADAITRTVDASLTSGGTALAGDYTGAASYDPARRVLTVTQSDYTYAVALPAAGTVRFFSSDAALRFGTDPTAVPTGTSGAWSVTLPATGTYAAGIGFAVGDSAEAATSAAAAATAAGTVSGAEADLAAATATWNTYLAKVPAPQDFSLHGVATDGVTPAAVKSAYYRAWVDLEQNVLPATPETGNSYAQLGTGKASLWMNGTPGIREVASWDSLLGMQQLVYADPSDAWAAFQGLMAQVDSDGTLNGESLPSRKAQTAWVLYQVTGDSGKLASTYDALSRHLTWESQNLRWILGDHDYPDERDAEFVASLIVDLGYAQQISDTLGKPADAATWKQLAASLVSDYQTWFFPKDGGTLQKVFLEGSHPDDPGLTMYTSTGLHIPGLGTSYADTLTARFLADYDPRAQFAGLAGTAIKAPDAQYMTYGLLDHGMAGQADVLVNSITRDEVRSGWFAEVYQAAPDGTGTPVASGVRPSLFGMANLIDNVWMDNGYRLDLGDASFVRLSADNDGGVSGLTHLGKTLDVDLDQGTVRLSGAAAKQPGACTTLHPAVGQTLSLTTACATAGKS